MRMNDGAPLWPYAKLLAIRPWLRYSMRSIWGIYKYETGAKGNPTKLDLFYLRRYAVNLLRMEFSNPLPFDESTKEAMRYVH